MAAARHQAQVRRLDRVVAERARHHVAVQVVHRHERQPPGGGDRLCRRHAHQQRADQPRPARDRDGVHVVEPGARALERVGRDRVHQLEVVARGDLRARPRRSGRAAAPGRRSRSTRSGRPRSRPRRTCRRSSSRGRGSSGRALLHRPPHDERVLAVVVVVARGGGRRRGTRTARTAGWRRRSRCAPRACTARSACPPARTGARAARWRCPGAAGAGSTATFIRCQTVS